MKYNSLPLQCLRLGIYFRRVVFWEQVYKIVLFEWLFVSLQTVFPDNIALILFV